jgi:hypothetical protein
MSMTSAMPTLRIVEVFQDWDPIQEREFLDAASGQEEVLIRVPLPSHGRTNSYLDICDELLEASYFCETLSAEFECGKLERKYEQHSEFFLLPVRYQDALKLASTLFRLQWTFNTPEDSALKEVAGTVREAVLEHEERLPEATLRYPEIVDAYFANRINGAYYDYPEDLLSEEFSKHPERRFGFWKSPHFNGEPSAVYLSHDAWLVPSTITKEEAFKRHNYPESGLSLLNADMISLNETAVFLSEHMALTLPLKQIAEGMACLKFAEEDFTQALWPGRPRFFVSEFKDFAIIESGGISAVFFHVTEARADSIDRSLVSLLERHKSETYAEPAIKIDWTLFDDETFEELCYDLVYHDHRFDKSTIRKMGKSRSRDGGRDIVAMTRALFGEKPRKFIFQCKAIAPDKSLTTSNLGSMSDVIDQFGANGYVVMTCGFIDATVFDRLDGIAATRKLEVITWSRFEIERFLARRPSLLDRYIK